MSLEVKVAFIGVGSVTVTLLECIQPLASIMESVKIPAMTLLLFSGC